MYPTHIQIQQLIDQCESLKTENRKLRMELNKADKISLEARIVLLQETQAYTFEFKS